MTIGGSGLKPRPIDAERDRAVLLDSHCRVIYAAESLWARATPFDAYQRWWLGTPQPSEFLADLCESMRDARTIAEFWEDAGELAAYVWVRFTDLPDSGLTIAEIEDLFVVPGHRRQGVARAILFHVEQLARERGAHLLRSGTGVENLASQKLQAGAGFRVRRYEYEKVLKAPQTAGAEDDVKDSHRIQ